MDRPSVRVGVMSAPTIEFSFSGIYSTPGTAVVDGEQQARVSDSGLGVVWNGRTYSVLDFTPTSPEGDSFCLKGVTIGVGFHWQRREDQRFRGSLRLIARGGMLTAINILGVEEYLTSVISSEMSSHSSLPLLQAHAVISRSWLLAQIDRSLRGSAASEERMIETPSERIKWYDRSDHTDFDVCADDHCQRYQGISRISAGTAASAVADTLGQVLMAGQVMADTRFSKCCGGMMEEFGFCWADTPHDYLRARRDDVAEEPRPDLTREEEAGKWILSEPESFCNTSDYSVLSQVLNDYDRETPDFFRWKVEYTQEQLAGLIRSRSGIDFGKILSLKAIERGKSGRISRLEIRGTLRTMVIGKELEIRRTLSESHLRSSAFVADGLEPDAGGVPSRFVIRGAGWGHGVGLCQIGAAMMAERGYTYREILRHYYPGADLKTLYL